ncbi:hypothetical protein [Hyphobacterium marinum]|uniref:Uncharacterized protein n=1 Tax=Hyphobacterium marinum TaxID=3116574 RepID=A0ABU7LXE4_9PROT|nr:hypothetical protein [Hyphobacterium sp. Y6023]MEE2566208.1 hypothetical protein [Hyphobacterium sp. Y6023]
MPLFMSAVASALALSTPASITIDPLPFGQDVEPSAGFIAEHCTASEVRELDPATMPLATTSYRQVDCEGFDYFGGERRAEFVYADGALTHVWVLVEADELDALQREFETAYGSPDHDTADFAAFNARNTAIRRDVPEALYYSDAAAPLFQQWFASTAQ